MNDSKTITGADIAKGVFQAHEVDAGTGELRRVQLKRACALRSSPRTPPKARLSTPPPPATRAA